MDSVSPFSVVPGRSVLKVAPSNTEPHLDTNKQVKLLRKDRKERQAQRKPVVSPIATCYVRICAAGS